MAITVRLITGVAAQARGLRGTYPVPEGVLYLFPRVRSRTLSTIGMHEGINVLCLDAHGGVLELERPVPSGIEVELPPGTAHVVEAAAGTPITPNLSAVLEALTRA